MKNSEKGNKERLLELKAMLIKTLVPLINQDYTFLDIPNHANIGDSLITLGAYEILKHTNHSLLYKASIAYCRKEKIPQQGILLFNGGGNFGDLWPGSGEFRREIIAQRPHQKVIIFPQSVCYKNLENLRADVAVFDRHPNLTICARDNVSFTFFQKHFSKNKILLLPDMAFGLDYTAFQRKVSSGKLLFLKRNDKELKVDGYYNDLSKLIFSCDQALAIKTDDWPGLRKRSKYVARLKWEWRRVYNPLVSLVHKTPLINKLTNDCFGFGSKHTTAKLGAEGIKMFSKYDVIYITRLHGLILALLLNKRVICLDNSYGKISAFYHTWLRDFDNCILLP